MLTAKLGIAVDDTDQGIALLGTYSQDSNRIMPFRLIGEHHAREGLGFIPG